MARGQLGEPLGALLEPRLWRPCTAAPSPRHGGALAGAGLGAALRPARPRPAVVRRAGCPRPKSGLDSVGLEFRDCPPQTAHLLPLGLKKHNVVVYCE